MLSSKPALVVAAVLLLSPLASFAQFAQYTPPGSLGREKPNRKEQVEQAVSNARWHLGPIRLDPALGIRDLSYQDNLFATSQGQASDLTATLVTGLRAYLPTGSKLTWVAAALPQYVWWQKNSDRRRWNGRYGAAAFGFFNRLTLGATASRTEDQGFVTSEVLQRTEFRRDEASLDAEIRLGAATTLFASDRATRDENQTGPETDPRIADFALLDRDERVNRAGVRYRFRSGIEIGLGAERSRVDFLGTELDQSNSGTSPLVELASRGKHLGIDAEVVFRSLSPEPGSSFVPFDGTTGQVVISYRTPRRLRLALGASRGLVYSLEASYSYFTDERVSFSIGSQVTRRGSLTFFVEQGANTYTVLLPGTPARTDDVTSFGGRFQVQVFRGLSAILGAYDSRFDSNLPGASRDVTVANFGLTLGGGEGSLWF